MSLLTPFSISYQQNAAREKTCKLYKTQELIKLINVLLLLLSLFYVGVFS